MRSHVLAAVGILAAALSVDANAEVHRIAAAGIKFNPMITYIEPGDDVAWTNMLGHNVETIDTMVPEGQEKILSELSKDVYETFEKEGIIVYKCTPHWGTRMGGIIVVGQPDNVGEIVSQYMSSLELEENKGNKPAKGLLRKLERELVAKGWMESPDDTEDAR